MDFIERLFGWSPDDGNGMFEFLLFVIPLAGIVYVVWRRRQARQRQRKDRD